MKALVIAMIVCSASPAFAWDGAELWYGSASADNPGGGGILGTGGAHDAKITCKDCHMERVDNPNLRLDMQFSPPLPVIGGMASYVPGQRYTIAVQLVGHQLAEPCTMPYTKNTDGFAASFEDDAGDPAGTLDSDSQPAGGACPQTTPSATAPGTTSHMKDCAVIFSKGNPDRDAWTFSWTAPSSGAVHVYHGAVDGDCDMMSMGDSVVMGSTTLRAPTVASATPGGGSPWPLALVTLAIVAPLGARRPRARPS